MMQSPQLPLDIVVSGFNLFSAITVRRKFAHNGKFDMEVLDGSGLP